MISYVFLAVAGCAYFEPPANTYVTYEPDLATVVCNYTGETWFLTCGTTSWLGRLGNCTKSSLPQARTQFPWGKYADFFKS